MEKIRMGDERREMMRREREELAEVRRKLRREADE